MSEEAVAEAPHSKESQPLAEDIAFAELTQILTDQARSDAEVDLVRKAFAYGRLKHQGQFRKNNDNYIVHPVCVAGILAKIPLDTATVAAAILHDTLEDTDATAEEIQNQFGEEILKLVEGVTKLGQFKFSSKEDRQAENFRRMFLAMADDIRVIMLKLADRLHNMRTMDVMAPEKQVKIASETLEIFAPLANRMGMGKMRAELEDLSLRYIHPEQFEEIETELQSMQEERESTIEQVIERIESQLKTLQIPAKIYGRVKNYYSIYKKMETRQKKVHEIYDISAVRVIVDTDNPDSEKECYEVLGVIHNAFNPIPGRFKDYIAMPKSNLYKSLHTTVIGPSGRPLEIQIRTKEMHRLAEYGIAAHWRYKEAGTSTIARSTEEQQLSWLKQMIEMKDEADDAREYVDSIKLELFRDEVFVFTPKGKVIDLPYEATPVDFAYRIHTEVGHRCTGAVVNGKIVPLNHVLKNGDIIEILTSKKANPRLDWIKFVKTQQAKNRIRQWFKHNFREEHEHQGRQLLEAELSRAEVEDLLKSGRLLEIAKELNYSEIDDLFLAIGYGELTLPRVLNRIKLKKTESPTQAVQEMHLRQRNSDPSQAPALHKRSQIEGLQGMLHHIAKCCMPVPGDDIVGVVTRTRGVMIHRDDCINLGHVNPERVMEVQWGAGATKKALHAVKLDVTVIDRVGIFKDVLTRIADNNTNLTNARVKVQADQTAIIELTIDIANLEQLEQTMESIRRLNDVIAVKRHQPKAGIKVEE